MHMSEIPRSRTALFSAFASIICFASTPVFIAWLPTHIPYWGILFYALIIATISLFLAILLFYRNEFITFCRSTSIRGWWAISITSVIRLLVSLCFFFAVTHAPRVESTVLTLMWPIFFVLFSILLDNYQPNFSKILPLILSFVGVVIIIIGQDGPVSLEISIDSSLFGLLMALMAAILGGLHSLVYKVMFRDLKIPHTFSYHFIIIFFRSLIGFVLIGTTTMMLPDIKVPTIDQYSFLFIVPLGVFAYAGTQVLYCYALMKLDEVELANIQYFNPVIVTVLLSVFVGDPISPNFLLGAVIIFGAQYMIQSDNTFLSASRATLLLAFPVFIAVFFIGDEYDLFDGTLLLIHTEAPALIGTMYAIIVGFSLTRTLERNRLSDTKFFNILRLVSHAMYLPQYNKKINKDMEEYMRSIVDLDWLSHRNTRNLLFDNVIEKVELLTTNTLPQTQTNESSWMSSLKSATYEWAKLKAESAPRGEIICIWVLGTMTIFSLIAVNQGGLFRDILVLFFSLTIVYLCALIKDLNQNYGAKISENF